MICAHTKPYFVYGSVLKRMGKKVTIFHMGYSCTGLFVYTCVRVWLSGLRNRMRVHRKCLIGSCAVPSVVGFFFIRVSSKYTVGLVYYPTSYDETFFIK